NPANHKRRKRCTQEVLPMRLLLFFLTSAALALASAAETTPAKPAPQTDKPSAARKLLTDPNPRLRLRGALELTAELYEQAVGVLIGLWADLLPAGRRQAEQALRQLGGEWSPNPALPGEDEVSRKLRREVWAAWWKTVDGP